MASDIIDFQSERGRHEKLLGREDVMAELDSLLLGGPSRGWVLVKGGPGMGKSALLAEWLKRREDAGLQVPPHHFLRRGMEDWDRPEVVNRNLAAQVERLYPELAEPDARPESRLRELLQRVSDKALKPRNERLVMVVDGLDEVEGASDGSNPLKRFLPNALPQGVKVLCASRPTYPYLSWLEGLEGVRPLDLDGERWAGSNKNVVRQYWEHVASRFAPPLTPSFVGDVVQRAEGSVLYAVKLAEWLQEQPVEKRRVELLPRGLEALLEESWARIQALPDELREVAREGLGVVAVAREALPLPVLAAVAHWKDSDGERFLHVARSFLLEEPAHEGGEKAWRPFHESFRSFILSKLGHERERDEHRRLAEQLCRWPVETSEYGARWSYALRHGVTHWLKAGNRERARGLYTNLGYLEEKCRVAGVLSLEDALVSAAVEGLGNERELPRALLRVIQAESHHLRKEPEALPLLVYNRLRCSGWAKTRIEKTLCFPDGLPALRLRHPVKTGGNERTLEGHGDSVSGCAVTPDGRRVVSASRDNTLKVWELETGREVSTLEGHGDSVSGCAVTPDGRRVVSASWDNTLKVWELETGREVATLEGHGARVSGCAVTPDGRRVVSASWDNTLKVWELETGREVATLEGHRARVSGCAVTPDGRRVVSASRDNTLKVWELETGREVATLEGHGARVSGCAVTPDGRRVVSASWDNTLKVWEVETGREVAALEGHGASVTGCAVTPDGRSVVSASDDGTLKVWALETGREVATLEGHGDSVTGCVVTPDGRRVVSASDDGTLKVWELETGRCLHTLHGIGAFHSVAATSQVICAGDVLGNVWILELEPGVPGMSPAPMNTPLPGPRMNIPFPKPVLEACRSRSLALFIGSGLSLGRDVKGSFPTWSQLPHRLLDACERLGSLDEQVIQARRALFTGRMRLEVMLADLGSLRAALDRDYQKALNDIFRPADAAPGAAHQAVARLGVRAILTTNYDPLLERLQEAQHRQPYTWKESDLALNDLESGRHVLFKIHGTAERHDTVVMTESEYRDVRSNPSYRSVLGHLLQGYTFLFIGYGMNDPLDLDLVLKWNADAFKSAARRHYALLKEPSDTDRDRYEREYNVRVIPYSDHAQLPAILEELQRAAS
ncbi:SIR2 family protein [Archangium lansingense]|uniref:SIR2 family protein n=1 Tax=Archangium lansingense TaxID=2995310 RepID=UPI003B81B466